MKGSKFCPFGEPREPTECPRWTGKHFDPQGPMGPAPTVPGQAQAGGGHGLNNDQAPIQYYLHLIMSQTFSDVTTTT